MSHCYVEKLEEFLTLSELHSSCSVE